MPIDSLDKRVESPDLVALDRDTQSAFIPEEFRAELLMAAGVFALSCLYFLPFYSYSTLNADEGLVLQGAQRILRGEVLYRDFFSFFTPGSYYWMALLFKVFGDSILVARAVLVVYGGIYSLLVFLLARRVCSRGTALLTVALLAMTGLPYRFISVHNWDSTLWALSALYAAVRLLESPNGAWAFTLGSLAAVTCLFEQSKGAGLSAGLLLGFVILAATGAAKVWTGWRRLFFLALGLLWPAVLTIWYFGAHRALPQMLSDIVWPLHHYSVANKVPYGYIERDWIDLFHGSLAWRAFCFVAVSPLFLLPALPLLGVCGLAWSTVQLWRRKMASHLAAYYILLSAALTGLLLGALATSRCDVGHIVFQAPLFYLVLAWLLEAAKRPSRRALGGWAVAYTSVSFSTLGLVFLLGAVGARYRVETRRGTLRVSNPNEVLKNLQSRIPPGEAILVYPYQPLYYYLTATYSISRYEWIFPGMYDAAQYREIVADLEAARPRVVLFNPNSRDRLGGGSPNMPVEAAAASDPACDYLFSHYHACRTFLAQGAGPPVVFMLRNGLPCALDTTLAGHE
jgi:hypothetical protein